MAAKRPFGDIWNQQNSHVKVRTPIASSFLRKYILIYLESKGELLTTTRIVQSSPTHSNVGQACPVQTSSCQSSRQVKYVSILSIRPVGRPARSTRVQCCPVVQCSPVQSGPVDSSLAPFWASKTNPVQPNPVQPSQIKSIPIQCNTVQCNRIESSPVPASPVQASPVRSGPSGPIQSGVLSFVKQPMKSKS